MLIIPGFIISGGMPANNLNNFELYNPTSGNSCPPQDMQLIRYRHSSCSNLICGGSFFKLSCSKITGTEVFPLPSLILRQERFDHLCWSLPEQKILLLGGAGSQTTTEIVSGSSSSDSFDLEYGTQ